MRSIEDYRKAQCQLYRLPPIDTSGVEEIIQTTLLEAWKNGENIKNVVNNILQNQQVVSRLSEQVSGNLNFQRIVELQNARDQNKTNLEQYALERQEKLKRVDTFLGSGIVTKYKELGEVSRTFQDAEKDYSVTKRKLEELRARVQERLKQVGGEKGVETLLTINNAVTRQSTYPETKSYTEDKEELYKKPEKYSNEDTSEKIKDALKYAAKDKRLKEKLETKIEEEITEEKKGFFRKVWKVLNYKIW